MRKPDKCLHYNGSINDACEAGVKYEDVRKPRESGVGFSLPCVGRSNDCGATCAKLELPTAEQIQAEEEQIKARMDRMMAARKAIVDHLGGPWKKGASGSHGSIPCPSCGAALRFSRSGYNGHIHAACATDDCTAWME